MLGCEAGALVQCARPRPGSAPTLYTARIELDDDRVEHRKNWLANVGPGVQAVAAAARALRSDADARCAFLVAGPEEQWAALQARCGHL